MAGVETFEKKFLGFKEAEESKNQLIRDLIARVKELETSLSDQKLHLEREQEATKSFQGRLHDALFTIKRREQEIDSNAFVSVLIDGDCMLFLDHFVISAEQGGMDAARYLRSAVSEYLASSSSPNFLALSPNIPIRIRVYANLKGLSLTYCNSHILDDVSDFQMFVRGFNMGNALCDFVDAGDGKECADSKLKEWFTRDLADVQCKAILFGGSSDNGYARLLQPFVGDEPRRDSIVLIEGPPFVKELAALSGHFPVTQFPKVFRNNAQLPSRGVITSFHSLPGAPSLLSSQAPSFQPLDLANGNLQYWGDLSSPSPLPSSSLSASALTSSAPATYASTSAIATSIAFLTASMPLGTTKPQSTSSKQRRISSPPKPKTTTQKPLSSPSASPSPSPSPAPSSKSQSQSRSQPLPILRNSKNQRLDRPLNPSKTLLHSLRNKKQCNAYHIFGTCAFPDCGFAHGKRLDAAGIEARRWIARQTVCPQGFACVDELCFLGHECPQTRCGKVGNGCRFKREMHNVDRSGVVVDG